MLENSINNKRIAKNTFFLYFRLLFTMFISLYTTRTVLNVLGVTDYGIYNVVCGFVALFSFLNTTMSNGIQRFYNYEAGKDGIESITKVYQTAISIQLLLAIVLLLILEPLGTWYINNRMVIPSERLYAANWVFQFSLFSLVLLVLQVPFSAAVMAHEKMNYYAIVGIIDAILKLVIVLILPYFNGDSLIIYGLLTFLISLTNLLLYMSYALKNFKELKLSKVFHKNLFISIFKFTGWNLVEMFAWTTQGQGVNIILNHFYGPTLNAAQGIANQVSSALNSFCTNLSIAFRPQLVRSYAEGNYSRTTSLMYTMSKVMFAMVTIMIVPIILEMKYIFYIWLGDNIPDYTIQFSTLILISMLPRNMTTALSQVIHASGQMKNYQLGSAAVVLLILPISFILLKNGADPTYIYVINIFIFIMLWIVDVLLARRVFEFSLKYYAFKVAMPCVITLILSPILPFVCTRIMNEGIWRLILVLIISILSCVTISFLLLLNSEEKRYIKNIITARFK